MAKQFFSGLVGSGAYNQELYVTSGTVAGTAALTTGPAFGFSLVGAVYGGPYLYFQDFTSTNAIQVWSTDGTSAPAALDAGGGTVSYYAVKDMTPLATASGAIVVFLGNTKSSGAPSYQLYSGSGAAAGSTKALAGVVFSSVSDTAVVSGSRAYFTGTTAGGTEVWATDGSTATNLDPTGGASFSYAALASTLIPFKSASGDAVAFFGKTSAGTYQLYVSDGTGAAGTHTVGNAFKFAPTSLYASGSNVYVLETDAAGNNAELYATDGTGLHRADPAAVNDAVAADTYTAVSYPTAFTASAAGKLAFFGHPAGGAAGSYQLYVSNGTGGSGTVAVGPVFSSLPSNFIDGNGRLFFTGTANGATSVWVTDGSTATRLDPNAGAAAAGYQNPTGLKAFPTAAGTSVAFFATPAGSSGLQLYVSDGTAGAGTKPITGAAFGSNTPPGDITAGSGRVYFTANDMSGNRAVWTSDGSTASRLDVAGALTSNAYSYLAPNSLTAFTEADGTPALAFIATETAATKRVLIYLSTGGSTVAIGGAAAGASPIGLTANGSTLYFTARDASGGTEVWSLVGTTATKLDPTASTTGDSYTGATLVTPVSYSIAAADASKQDATSGTTNYTFSVSRTGDTQLAANLGYTVSGSGSNPASSGLLATKGGTVSFAPGVSVATIAVAVNGAQLVSDAGFQVTLAAGTGSTGASAASIVTPLAAGTIRANTAAPSYAIAATDAQKAEGSGGTTPFTFTVMRSGDSSGAATLSYAVTGSGTNPAAADDFAGGRLPSGSVAFAAGETSKTITIGVDGDTSFEPDETFTVTLSGPAGTAITSATATGTILNDDKSGGTLAFANATSGQSGTLNMDVAGAGGPSYLVGQYIYAGNDDLAIATQSPNVFIRSGTGFDAIQVASGQNVLDGGLGSNFLTGGSGTDTFFTDSRSPGVVWNTIRNFHAGDAATLWGFTAGTSSYRWEANVAGAAGSEGATLRANIVGGSGRSGDGIDASITFTGMSVDQARGLQIVTGTQPAGNYLYIYNPGV